MRALVEPELFLKSGLLEARNLCYEVGTATSFDVMTSALKMSAIRVHALRAAAALALVAVGVGTFPGGVAGGSG
jgi:hypothetical protein